MKDNNKKEFNFPPEKEIKEVIKRFEDPSYDRVNIGLKPNASELDKAKYNVCQSIAKYKRENKLTSSELAGRIKIGKGKTEDILFGRISKFNFEELASFAEKLNGHLEIKVNYDKEKSVARAW